MASLVTGVRQDLKDAGFSQADVDKAVAAVKDRLSKRAYEAAVWFLGLVTIILAGGAIAAVLLKSGGAEGLWGAVGAGVGALAGIFKRSSE